MNNNSSVNPYRKKKIIWDTLLFIGGFHLLALIGVPLYIYHFGITAFDLAIFFIFYALTGGSITIGYHRLFAHKTYKAHPVIRFLLLFFGAAAFEQSCLTWSAQHRTHHTFADTERDPYSVKEGFWHAHMGWIFNWEHKVDYDNVKDLQEDPMIMHQHNHYGLWGLVAGIALPVFIGALFGNMLGAFIFGVCFRLAWVYQVTFCINSVCHLVGKSTYDIHSTAKDHWFVAFFTNGEGYHNFHHRFPNDYRNGIRWFDWDPSKWTIRLWGLLGFATDLKKTSQFRILAAKHVGEKNRIAEEIDALSETVKSQIAKVNFKEKYENLRTALLQWEKATDEYQAVLQKNVKELSEDLQLKVDTAKQKYLELCESWKSLVEEKSMIRLQILGAV